MTTYFVSAVSGSSGNTGLSWASPKQTVAQALALTTPTVVAVDSAGTFTAAQKGLLESRIYVGAASTTLYVDPVLEGVS